MSKKLQSWMTKNEMDDSDVAKRVKVTREQINRIRNSKRGAGYETAKRLERLTGIDWYEFTTPTRRRQAKASRKVTR
jgi:transcriptional regulator with XRE-family HTH domain